MCPPKSVGFPESIAGDKALGGGAGKSEQGSRPVGKGRKNIQPKVNSGGQWGSTL